MGKLGEKMANKEEISLKDVRFTNGVRIIVGSPDCTHTITIKFNDNGKLVIENVDRSIYHDRMQVDAI